MLEPSTATTLANFSGLPNKEAAITVNKFGKGQAIYVSMPSTASVMSPILDHVLTAEGIRRGPDTPEGVYARVVDKRILFVNSTAVQQTVKLQGRWREILSGKESHDTFGLEPFGVGLLDPEQ